MRRSKTPLVVITGVDGSGKTTIAKLLTEHLKTRGCMVRQVWIKSLHTLAYLISMFFQLVKRGHFIKNPNKIVITRFQSTDYKFLSKVWPFIEFVSVLPWILLKVYFPVFFGFIIIADRYVTDTVVMISTSVKDEAFVDSFLGRLLLKMIPKGTIIIHLDIDLDTVLRRRLDIEYTIPEIENQIMLYRTLADKVGAYTINTAKLGVEETIEEILEKLPL